MYRNCVYNSREKKITLFTWDAHGNRVREEVDYYPYLYLEDKKGEESSIYGTRVKKKEFANAFERKKFLQQSNITRVFENLPPAQQFLIDNYWMHCENDDFAKNEIKVMYLDIETYSKEFPDVETAPHTINLITVYDSLTKKYHTFGLKPYTSKNKNVNYTHCLGEEQLLKNFLKFYRSDYPDALVGWNNVGFDIPYLINRIVNVLGEDYVRDLSPVGRYYERIDKTAKFGTPMKYYVIEGVASIDYMVMYKKFSMDKQESYSLNYIAEVELGKNKIQYDGKLWELADNDWNTFVDYNIQDVELLVDLEHELQYIELLRFTSYLGMCDMEKAVKTVGVINGAIAVRARQRGEMIPTFVRPKTDEKIPGGYVAAPIPGLYENIVSFDANSLYPSVMISLNLSPETKLGRIEKVNDNRIDLYHVSGKRYELTPDQFKEFVKREDASLTKAKFLFSQKKRGIMPEFLDFLYRKRKEMKGKMIETKKYLKENKDSLSNDRVQELETLIKKLDTYQNAYKITLNSTYGYCANKYAPLGDDDIGKSVTLTGQAAIKKSNDLLTQFLKIKNIEISDEELSKVLIYNDTDSYVAETEIVTNKGIFDAASLWNEFQLKKTNTITTHGHEIQSVENDNLEVRTYDSKNNIVKWGKVKNLIRHKVSKKKYKIKAGGKEIIMTEDHGCMAIRDGELVRVSPKEIIDGDNMIIIDNNRHSIVSVEAIHIGEFVDEYVYDLEMCPDSTESTFFANDILIHNSCYISFKCIDQIGLTAVVDGKVTPEFYKFCDEVENYINAGMTKWAKTELNSSDSRFVFKREAICDKGILIGKKYYVLHVLDSEGIPINEFKYKGVDVVKTTMSKELKPDIKDIIECLIMENDLDKTNQKFNDVYQKFLNFDIRSICKISGVNNFESYVARADGLNLAPKTPSHVKAGYYHDLLVDKLGLTAKYEKFKTGDKIRWVYLKTPNAHGMSVMAFKDKFPEEFKEHFVIDYDIQFEKIIFAAIGRFYEAVGWTLRKPSENVRCELSKLLEL